MTSIIVFVWFGQAHANIDVLQWVIRFLFIGKRAPNDGVGHAQIVVDTVVFKPASITLFSGPMISAYLNDKVVQSDE